MAKKFMMTVAVEFKHLDTQNYVNHSNLYTYIENIYIMFFMKEIKTGWRFSNMPILLKESSTRFFKPVTEYSELTGELEVIGLRSKGVEIQVTLRDSNIPNLIYVSGKRTLIHCDLESGNPKDFSSAIFQRLKYYLLGDT